MIFVKPLARRSDVDWTKLRRLERDLMRCAAVADAARETHATLRRRLQEVSADLGRFELIDALQHDLAGAGEPHRDWADPVSALACVGRKTLKGTRFAAFIPQLDEALQLREQVAAAAAEFAQVSARAGALRTVVTRCQRWAEGRDHQ